MPTLLEPAPLPIVLTDTVTAQQSSRELARLLKGHEGDTLRLHVQSAEPNDGADVADIAVSGAALRVLVQVLEEMGKGHTVTVLSARQEMTPQQAANLLGMSRTLLTSLLARGEIPFRYVGSHKRIRVPDVLAFRAAQESRHQILNELTAQAQELNMGY